MSRDIKPLFDWANKIGDANINNRILAKAMPALIAAKFVLTDTMIREDISFDVPYDIFDVLKKSAEELLNASYEEGK
ncbi:MAG: hypothetical protein WBK95_00665 [Sulfurimonas sp.]|nr:hypothetical protein [Sulfurimonas sp.]MDD5201923.1 hypothetical protein [Sulfurimonas sp.]